MRANELLAAQLRAGQWTLERAASDLDDDDFTVELPGGGESALWVFEHLAVNEDWFLNVLLGTASPIDVAANEAAIFQADFPGPDVLARGPVESRAHALSLFDQQRQRVYAALAVEDANLWNSPPPQGFPAVFDSRGAVWGILGTHQYWHLGQVMSIRTMLGKPTFEFNDAQHRGGPQ